MGFVMKNGKTGLDSEQSRGERGAPDVTVVGGAASLTVTVSYPHAAAGDVCRVAYYPRGAEAPLAIFIRPSPIAEARIHPDEDHPLCSHTFDDVPAGDYDVYYHLTATRGEAQEWTNTAPDRLSATPAPLRATVGGVAGHEATDVSGYFGGQSGTVTLGW